MSPDGPGGSRDSSAPVVLVADDDLLSRKLLRSMLEANGLAVLEAADGLSAIAAARSATPDIILLDVDMGDGPDGFEVCERLKGQAGTGEIPVIFLTAANDVASRIRGLSIGGVDYVAKPFEAQEILLRLRIHIDLRRADKYVIEAQRNRLAGFREAAATFATDVSALPDSRASVHWEPSQEAGGDQYDVLRLGASVWSYFIADVSGHGNEAALLSTAVKTLFRENASLLTPAESVFRRMNSVMRGFLREGQFVTASCLTLNQKTREAKLASAGHLPVVLSLPGGRTARWRAEGDVVGAFDEPFFRTESLVAEPGTRFWLVSDGVVEEFGSRRSWAEGLAALEAAVGEAAGLDREAAIERVRGALFSKHPGDDDRLFLVCEL